MKHIAVLGSTGSIGLQTLDVCREQGYKITALSAFKNAGLLESQAREFLPECVCIGDETLCTELKKSLSDTNIRVLCGVDGLCELAALGRNDIVLNAVVGMVGIRPTMAAIAAGKDVALANKETLVAAGELVMRAAAEKNVKILPVDSEHSAIFQCLSGNNKINKLILTASGGAFFGKSRKELASVTVNEALCHPNWSMGRKITVDSGTLMNKGLELIEAVHLFSVPEERIEIVVHRQSVVHSLVEFCDYSVLAQLGVPDMKIPIQYALTYPAREKCSVGRLRLAEYGTLTFSEADSETFGCLSLARRAARTGGLLPCIMNAANEEAVGLFLEGKIGFLEIEEAVANAMDTVKSAEKYTLDDVFRKEKESREAVMRKYAK